MRIGLLRHGIAEDDATTDFERALTEEGRAGLEAQLDAIARHGWVPRSILHSPTLRTTQTADQVGRRYPRAEVWPLEALTVPAFDPILRAAAQAPDPLLVGHEPILGNLAARLLGAPSGAIRFERGGFALLDVDRIPSTRPARLLLFLPPPGLLRT